MHCEVYQRTVRSLRHRNICEEFTALRLHVLLTSLLKVCFPCGRFCCERLALSKVERCIFVSGPRRQPSRQPCVRLSFERYHRRNWQFTSNKAVADGAVSFYIDHFVSARVSKFAYGVEIYEKFDVSNSEHQRRKNLTFMTPQGYLGIDGIFSVILPQVRCSAIYSVDFNLTLMLCSEDQGLRDPGI